jgi:hypothetical protein
MPVWEDVAGEIVEFTMREMSNLFSDKNREFTEREY